MRKLKTITATIMAVAVAVLSVMTASADDTCLINGSIEAKVGDKVTYNLYISDVPEKVEDLQIEVDYNADCLEAIDDSVTYPDGGSSVYNTKIAGQVLFNSANGIEGWDFKEKTLLFGCSFKVKSAGESEISQYIQCMDYLSNSQSVDDYVLTTEFLVNEKTVEEGNPPVINPAGQGGNFINFENGKGVKNGGDKAIGGAYGAVENNNQDGNVDNGDVANNGDVVNNGAVDNGEAGNNVVGQEATVTAPQPTTTATTVVLTNSSGVAITTPDGQEKTWSESNNTWRNIGIVALSLAIVACIVITVMIRKKKSANPEENNSEKE